MSKLNELNKVLLNKEMNLMELSNEVALYGFYDFCDDGITSDIIADKNVAITSEKTNEVEYIINFDIVCGAEEDETEESTIIKVTSIEKF